MSNGDAIRAMRSDAIRVLFGLTKVRATISVRRDTPITPTTETHGIRGELT